MEKITDNILSDNISLSADNIWFFSAENAMLNTVLSADNIVLSSDNILCYQLITRCCLITCKLLVLENFTHSRIWGREINLFKNNVAY
jgi:hypothetical protein